MYSVLKGKFDHNEETDEKINGEMEIIKKNQKVKVQYMKPRNRKELRVLKAH